MQLNIYVCHCRHELHFGYGLPKKFEEDICIPTPLSRCTLTVGPNINPLTIAHRAHLCSYTFVHQYHSYKHNLHISCQTEKCINFLLISYVGYDIFACHPRDIHTYFLDFQTRLKLNETLGYFSRLYYKSARLQRNHEVCCSVMCCYRTALTKRISDFLICI